MSTPHRSRATRARTGRRMPVCHHAPPFGDVLDVARHQLPRGVELLEDRADRAFGKHAERRREHLEVEAAVHELRVQQRGDRREQLPRAPLVREIHRRQCRRAQRLAEQAAAGEEEAQERRDAVRGIRRALPDAVVPAHDVEQRPQLAHRGVLRGDALVRVRRVREIVERDRVGRESCVALLHRRFEQLLHAAEFLCGRLAAHRGLRAHHLDPEHRVRQQRHDVRAERQTCRGVRGSRPSCSSRCGRRPCAAPTSGCSRRA